VFLWLRITDVRVIVSIAYEEPGTEQKDLQEFAEKLKRLGAHVILVPVRPEDICTCISQALWLRNLAYQYPDVAEDDLMMISEGDVFISSSNVLAPLEDLKFRAWIYWIEPALHGGQTFAMSFTTMRKSDWRIILGNSSSCQEALHMFKDAAGIKTLAFVRSDFGKHWESDQNIVTAQLLRLGICSVPKTNPLNNHFIREEEKDLIGRPDSTTCYKGQGFGECRWPSLGNHWFEEVGDCPWWHHQFPLKLLQQIVERTGEDWVYGWLIDTGEGGSKAFSLWSIHPFEYYQ